MDSKMPLRDWFAGRALALIAARSEQVDFNFAYDNIARCAYAIADAMIAHGYPPKRCGRTACDEEARPGGFCDEHTPY